MVLTPASFTLSSYSANSTSEIAKILFEDDTDKVNYVLSFLKGTALDWFLNLPSWIPSNPHGFGFRSFPWELKANFGTYDPVGEAEAELEGLHMDESHQAMKYFIKFQQLAAHVGWGNAALHRQAYNRLAKCIKDDMVTTISKHPCRTPKTRPSYWCMILE